MQLHQNHFSVFSVFICSVLILNCLYYYYFYYIWNRLLNSVRVIHVRLALFANHNIIYWIFAFCTVSLSLTLSLSLFLSISLSLCCYLKLTKFVIYFMQNNLTATSIILRWLVLVSPEHIFQFSFCMHFEFWHVNQ